MFPTSNDYDRGINTFSPEGRLFQVEYAIEAVKLGSTAVGVQVADGVVLAVEKRSTSKLLVASSLRKIEKLDNHIFCAMSGVVPDARTLIEHARVETQTHWFNYDEPIKVSRCVSTICDMASGFGEGNMARPFGVALLVGGVDEDGPALYHVDPSGTKTRFTAKVIGAGAEAAQTTLKEQYNRSMSLDEAKTLALDILKQVMEEKITEFNVEVAVIPLEIAAV